jgi:Tfp pilus assembly protein PilO
VPISISLKGSHKNCLAFLSHLYKLPRLVTVSSVSPTPAGVSGTAQPNILANDNMPYTMTISATAYFIGKTAAQAPANG